MYYVQLLRLRKAFTWFAAIVGAIFLIVLAVLHYPHANVDVSGVNGTIPLSVVFLGSSLFAIIFATVCGRSLNQENQRPEMVWTKPISRERLALLYMLCDLAAIAAAFVYALALILITLASVGGLTIIKADAAAPASVCLGLGVAMMWNGELQGLTSWQIGRGGLIVGLSWAVFAWLLPACTALSALWNPAVHAAFVGINYLDPLAYLATGDGGHVHIGEGSATVQQSFLQLGLWTRAAITWSIGIAGWAVAIFAWKRLEV